MSGYGDPEYLEQLRQLTDDELLHVAFKGVEHLTEAQVYELSQELSRRQLEMPEAPSLPDPDLVGKDMVCPACMAPNFPNAHFCANCFAPISELATVDPIGQAMSQGWMLGRLRQPKTPRIFVVGIALFAIGVFTPVIALAMEDWSVALVCSVICVSTLIWWFLGEERKRNRRTSENAPEIKAVRIMDGCLPCPVCREKAPAVFKLDEQTGEILIDPDVQFSLSAFGAEVLEAAKACPEAVITVEITDKVTAG